MRGRLGSLHRGSAVSQHTSFFCGSPVAASAVVAGAPASWVAACTVVAVGGASAWCGPPHAPSKIGSHFAMDRRSTMSESYWYKRARACRFDVDVRGMYVDRCGRNRYQVPCV